jgi:Asp-tRNA(Asn)/Glu-tRNA(Gln) amidotransferase B subunit
VVGQFVGQVMKATRGQANPQLVSAASAADAKGYASL